MLRATHNLFSRVVARRGVAHTRVFCSVSPKDDAVPPQKEVGAYDRALDEFNVSCRDHPFQTSAIMVALRNGSWLGFQSLFYYAGVCSAPELAVGWLFARALALMRRPADIVFSIILSSLMPSLRRVQAANLLNAIPLAKEEDAAKYTKLLLEKGASRRYVRDVTEMIQKKRRHAENMQTVMEYVHGPVNKFGFSYYITGRLTTCATILGSAALVRYGIDLQALLESYGFEETLGDAAGSMAGAYIANIFFLPLHFRMATKMAPNWNTSFTKSQTEPWRYAVEVYDRKNDYHYQ